MIRRFFWISLACLSSRLAAQSLHPTLISNGGAHASSPTFGTLDWSIGETVTSTFDPMAGGGKLTQGFHQVFVNALTGTDESPSQVGPAFSPKVYPNPSMDWVQVESTEPVQVRLLDMLGVEVLPWGASSFTHSIALASIPAGSYLLEVLRKSPEQHKIFKLQIIH